MDQKWIDAVFEIFTIISKNAMQKAENSVKKKSFQIKRQIFRSIIELITLSVAILFLTGGIILFLNKFFPLYAVLIVISLILINLILIVGKFR